MTTSVDELARRLEGLWDGERASWKIEYEAPYFGGQPYWRVDLEWTSEHANPHHADWATYTWQFYGDTAEEAAASAVEWCEQLLPFATCDVCGGPGFYWSAPTFGSRTKIICEGCKGTGLAYPPEATG